MEEVCRCLCWPEQAQHLIKLSNKSSSGLEGGADWGTATLSYFFALETQKNSGVRVKGTHSAPLSPSLRGGEKQLPCASALSMWDTHSLRASMVMGSDFALIFFSQRIFVSMKITCSAVLHLKASTSHFFCFCRVFPETFFAALCTCQLSLISQRNAKHLSACYHAFKIIYRSGHFFWDSH